MQHIRLAVLSTATAESLAALIAQRSRWPQRLADRSSRFAALRLF